MDLIIKSRNGKLSERQQKHIEEKLGKLERHIDHHLSATVEISAEKRRNHKNELQRVQVTLVGEHGIILRADRTAEDLFAAIDLVQDVLQRQLQRYKDKHWRRGKLRRQGGELVSSGVPAAEATSLTATGEEEEERRIVRVKQFTLKPMFTDEAIEQMELLEHSFFVFRDADTSQISVVYRRHDGNYGLIVPI